MPLDETPDPCLVALARGGDRQAFGTLVVRYRAMAESIATRVVRDRDLGRELAQEAMLQAYLSLDRLRNDARFQSWLYGIVLNVCKSHLRYRRGAPVSLEGMAGGLQLETRCVVIELANQIAFLHEVAFAGGQSLDRAGHFAPDHAAAMGTGGADQSGRRGHILERGFSDHDLERELCACQRRDRQQDQQGQDPDSLA